MDILTEKCIKIEAGNYRFGLEKPVIRRIDEAVFSGTMKRPYLYNSTPAGSIRLDNIFISKNLVTVSDFREFTEAAGYATEAEREGWGWTWEGGRWNKKDLLTWEFPFRSDADRMYSSHPDVLPVLQVSWNDAAAYCSWISDKTGFHVRLPMEKEWEVYAALQGVPSITAYQNIAAMDFSGPLIPVNGGFIHCRHGCNVFQKTLPLIRPVSYGSGAATGLTHIPEGLKTKNLVKHIRYCGAVLSTAVYCNGHVNSVSGGVPQREVHFMVSGWLFQLINSVWFCTK